VHETRVYSAEVGPKYPALERFPDIKKFIKKKKSFEDRERTLKMIVSLFFNTLYLCTYTFVSHLVISYNDFLFFLAPNS
jgi:hypothetical protein